jgi:hypothetical protein
MVCARNVQALLPQRAASGKRSSRVSLNTSGSLPYTITSL